MILRLIGCLEYYLLAGISISFMLILFFLTKSLVSDTREEKNNFLQGFC